MMLNYLFKIHTGMEWIGLHFKALIAGKAAEYIRFYSSNYQSLKINSNIQVPVPSCST